MTCSNHFSLPPSTTYFRWNIWKISNFSDLDNCKVKSLEKTLNEHLIGYSSNSFRGFHYSSYNKIIQIEIEKCPFHEFQNISWCLDRNSNQKMSAYFWSHKEHWKLYWCFSSILKCFSTQIGFTLIMVWIKFNVW